MGENSMKSNAGFTLIEVMVAIVVLSIGLVGILGISSMTAAAAINNDRWNLARSLATSRLEEISARPLDVLQAEFDIAPTGTEIVGRFTTGFTVQWWLIRTGTTSDPIQVTVEVRYAESLEPIRVTTVRGFFL